MNRSVIRKALSALLALVLVLTLLPLSAAKADYCVLRIQGEIEDGIVTASWVNEYGETQTTQTGDSDMVEAGTTITLTVEPEKGYALSQLWFVDCSSYSEIEIPIDPNGTFVMPDMDIELHAEFSEVTENDCIFSGFDVIGVTGGWAYGLYMEYSDRSNQWLLPGRLVPKDSVVILYLKNNTEREMWFYCVVFAADAEQGYFGGALEAGEAESQSIGFDNGISGPFTFKIRLWLDTVWVTFDPNGADGTIKEKRAVRNMPYKLVPNPFTREGFTFVGWNTKADGSGDLYADEAEFTPTEDTTLYAQWEQIPGYPAEDADDTLVIAGGETKDNMEVVDGKACLKVAVALHAEPEEEGHLDSVSARAAEAELLFGATFDITYDKAQLTFVDYETPDGNPMDLSVINPNKEGLVKFAFASSEGADASEDIPLVTMFFEISEAVKVGDEIAFVLADGAFVEVESAMKPVAKELAEDFEPFVVTEGDEMTGTVVIDEDAVEWKGVIPYLIWDAENPTCEPSFKVLDEEGNIIDPAYYDYEYKENELPGTGYIFVYFKGLYSGECNTFFKIYLPASEWLTVENVEDGILLNWAPVEGAAGYVIYRRAWSSTTNGWTKFDRWDNTTETSYKDGVAEGHKVYAGTRYQYGVKAYFERRLDPIANEEIGGNVNEPSGNYNLGVVSPLKTTVRITTRVLNEVTAGSKSMTIKWSASKNFTGYEVRYADNEAFTNAVTIKIDDWHTAETTVKDLAAGTYYVTVRSYHIFEGTTYYGGWSNMLTCTVE